MTGSNAPGTGGSGFQPKGSYLEELSEEEQERPERPAGFLEWLFGRRPRKPRVEPGPKPARNQTRTVCSCGKKAASSRHTPFGGEREHDLRPYIDPFYKG